MFINEENETQFPLEGRGFWIVQELTQMKRDNRLLLERVTHLTELMSDLKVQVASKLDKDDFFMWFDKTRTRGEERSRALIEMLKIVGASLGAAISALTGAKLMN